jgi:hypothetical protein
MVVEPASLCWLTGRIVPARDGVTWAQEFARIPTLLDLEDLRRPPRRLSAATRAWALVLTVQLTKACRDWHAEARRVRSVLRGVWRASSLLACVNSVARMQQARHRKMTQG